MTQLIGIAAVFAYVFSASLVLMYLLKWTIGLRVDRQEELEGLDIFEHGGTSYFFEANK